MGVRYNPGIVTDGLAVSLDVADKISYPGSGTTWYDLSGNGNNGTLSAAAIGTDISGTMDFNGDDEYISFGLTNSYINDSFTASAWVKADSLPGASPAGKVGIWGNFDGQLDGFAFGINSNGDIYYRTSDADDGGGGLTRTLQTGEAISIGVWTYITIVFDKTNAKVIYYKDGVSQQEDAPFESTPAVLDTDGSGVWIGRFPFADDSYWDGKIDIARMYTRSLTATQINQNFNAQRGRFGL